MKKILTILIFTSLFLDFSHPVSIEAATLHVLLVGDTCAEDLEESVIEDLTSMSRLLTHAAYFSGIDYQEVVLTDQNVNPYFLHQQLDALKVDSDDVMVFYFSGHGYRTQSKTESAWPNLYLTHDNVGLDLGAIIEQIQEKHPRLLLVFADCCNEIIPDWGAPHLIHRKAMMFDQVSRISSHFRDLFVNIQGKIVAVAAEPGCYAIGTGMGGVYTQALIRRINEAVYHQDHGLSWEQILEVIQSDVTSKELIVGVKQVPYYHADVSRVN